MIAITVPRSKTIPVDRFPLAWRWTEPSHAVFAADELAAIRAANAEASGSLRELLRESGISRALQVPGLPHERVLDAADLDATAVAQWLTDLPVHPALRVWLSYEWSGAIELPWSLFVTRWADFCYPSSDDLVVVPSSAVWVLEYWHYETFVWFPKPPAP